MHLQITTNSSSTPQIPRHHRLGLYFNETLTRSRHAVSNTISNVSAKIGFLRPLSSHLDSLVLRFLHTSSSRPSLEYGSLIWYGLNNTNADILEKCNWSAARIILKVRSSDSQNLPPDLLAAAGTSTLHSRRKLN